MASKYEILEYTQMERKKLGQIDNAIPYNPIQSNTLVLP